MWRNIEELLLLEWYSSWYPHIPVPSIFILYIINGYICSCRNGEWLCVRLSSFQKSFRWKSDVVSYSWLDHVYSCWAQTRVAVVVTLEVWEYQEVVSEVEGEGGAVGGRAGWHGMRRACWSVSRFQTSEFFWLNSLIRFIMHIPALIKVIAVWHSQCQSRVPRSTSTPLSAFFSVSLCFFPSPNACLEYLNLRLEIPVLVPPQWHL